MEATDECKWTDGPPIGVDERLAVYDRLDRMAEAYLGALMIALDDIGEPDATDPDLRDAVMGLDDLCAQFRKLQRRDR